MKKKYITTQILLACGSRVPRKDIYQRLSETIAERKLVLATWEQLFGEAVEKEIRLTGKQAA